MIAVLVSLSAVAGLATGLMIGWLRWRRVLVVLGALLALAIAALLISAEGATGWDGLDRVILAVLIGAPALVGLAIGGGAGLWFARRAAAHPPG